MALATLPRPARMNAKAAKVAKGAVAAHVIATLAVTRGGQLCGLSGLCVHRRGCDRSLTRPWGEQSVAFSERTQRHGESLCLCGRLSRCSPPSACRTPSPGHRCALFVSIVDRYLRYP